MAAMITTARFSVVALLLAATACTPKASTPAIREKAERLPIVAYVCEDGRVVRALYPDAYSVRLTLEGEMRQLKAVISGSGARYTGDGLQWWSKGDEAMLATLAANEAIATDPGVHCVPPTRAPVAPTEPGTPGALADDRAAPDKRSAQVGSAQAAATVVETYFTLIESGRTDAAARLRADGMPQNLGSYLTLGAQVGAPGRVKAAAGSLFVDVPVSIYGRYASGEAYLKSGKVVLRRVGDVPGTTSEQRRWRIIQFQLQTYSSASPPIR